MYKKRIPLFKKCLEYIEDDDKYMRFCWFLCYTYNVRKISKFFEGDLVLYKRIYLQLYSFTRKHNLIYKKVENIDQIGLAGGVLLEPVNASFAVSDNFKLREPLRKAILG